MISVTLINKNSEKTLKPVLQALTPFDEVIFYDSGSTDNSLTLAKGFTNVKIHSAPPEGFGTMHNKAASLASYNWILSIDSDEVLSPELAKEILSLSLDPHCVYQIKFHNYLNNKWIRCCGWYPDTHVRLYHRMYTGFTEAKVHEGIITEGKKIISLQHPLYHYSYGSISDFLVKMELYSTLFAKEYAGKKQGGMGRAFLHSLGAFCKSYFLKGGYRGGREGYLISRYNADTAFYKYVKLGECNDALYSDVPSGGPRQACQCKKDLE